MNGVIIITNNLSAVLGHIAVTYKSFTCFNVTYLNDPGCLSLDPAGFRGQAVQTAISEQQAP